MSESGIHEEWSRVGTRVEDICQYYKIGEEEFYSEGAKYENRHLLWDVEFAIEIARRIAVNNALKAIIEGGSDATSL